jgi:hypothetical protein
VLIDTGCFLRVVSKSILIELASLDGFVQSCPNPSFF